MNDLIKEVTDNEGFINPIVVSYKLDISISTLAETLNLPESKDGIQLIYSLSSQTRLHQLLIILDMIEPWCGSYHQAYVWFMLEIIPGFGVTACVLLQQDRAQAIMAYIHQISEGGYA